GVPSLLLMENAGRACADEALRMLGGGGGAVLVLVGPGNNGGDGLVIARTLFNRGADVRAWFVGPRARLDEGSDDFRTNARLLRGLGLELACCESAAELAALARELPGAALVVDALFGTGLTRPLAEPWRPALEALDAARRPVLAVDLP